MNENEISEICREYGFEHQSFSRFVEDFFITPHDELPPWPDDPVDREFDEVAHLVGLPAYVVRRAQEDGAVSNPLTSGDLDALRSVKKLFGRAWFLRAQLTKSSKAERQSLIERPELLPWERWVYNRFLAQKKEKADSDRAGASPDQRLYLSSLLRTLEDVFKVPASEMTKGRILQLRKMAANDYYASRKRGITLEEMAKKRGVVLESEQ